MGCLVQRRLDLGAAEHGRIHMVDGLRRPEQKGYQGLRQRYGKEQRQDWEPVLPLASQTLCGID